jgi:hypothetical protein
MYWEGTEGQVCKHLWEDRPKAREEHTCCECWGTIPVGEKYLYIVVKWHDTLQQERFFDSYKMCLSCERDWKTVIAAFQENGEKDARLIFGRLKGAIEDAFELGFLKRYDSLVQRWLPNVIESRTEEEKKADTWEAINTAAIRTGLQPALPEL